MSEILDCSEALAKIECFRRSQAALGKPLEPQLINWGLQALARESPNLNVRHGWDRMTTEQRWRRVRMNLSANAINALQRVLERRYGNPVDQLSLLESQQ